MNILDAVLSSSGGDAVKQYGQQMGLTGSDTEAVVRKLLPALSGSLKQNLGKPGGLEALTRALSTGNHQRYVEDPGAVRDPGAIADGNGILGHLFGSKDVSRNVASRVSADTGVNTDLVKKLLPVVAALAMGALSKQTAGGRQLQSQQGGLGGMLGNLLDTDGDGSIMDNLGALGRKLF